LSHFYLSFPTASLDHISFEYIGHSLMAAEAVVVA
jgi:hypothetical protein